MIVKISRGSRTPRSRCRPNELQPRPQGRRGADEGIGDQKVAADLLAERLEAGGLVDDGADGGEIEPLAGADIAVGDLALVQGDVEGERRVASGGFDRIQAVGDATR